MGTRLPLEEKHKRKTISNYGSCDALQFQAAAILGVNH